MPSKPSRYCACGRKVSGRCDTCKNRIDKERVEREGNAPSQGYDWQWKKVSAFVRRSEPTCRHCKQMLAQMVDHIVPLKQGGERLALDNLQPLCWKCHAVKTSNDKVLYGTS